MRAAEHDDEGDAVVSGIAVEGIVRVVGNDPSPQVVLSVGAGATTAQIALCFG
jgi:malic enzyme